MTRVLLFSFVVVIYGVLPTESLVDLCMVSRVCLYSNYSEAELMNFLQDFNLMRTSSLVQIADLYSVMATLKNI